MEAMAFKILVGKPEGSLGRPRRRWEDNIRMNLREIGCEGVDMDTVVVRKIPSPRRESNPRTPTLPQISV
jgi:hypothetical protein